MEAAPNVDGAAAFVSVEPNLNPPVPAEDVGVDDPNKFVGGGCAGVVLAPKRGADDAAGVDVDAGFAPPNVNPPVAGCEDPDAGGVAVDGFEPVDPKEKPPGAGAAAPLFPAGAEVAEGVEPPNEKVGLGDAVEVAAAPNPPKAGAGVVEPAEEVLFVLDDVPKENGFCCPALLPKPENPPNPAAKSMIHHSSA